MLLLGSMEATQAPLSLSRPKRVAASATEEKIKSSLQAQDARIPSQPSAPREQVKRPSPDTAPTVSKSVRNENAAPLPQSVSSPAASSSQTALYTAAPQVRPPCRMRAPRS